MTIWKRSRLVFFFFSTLSLLTNFNLLGQGKKGIQYMYLEEDENQIFLKRHSETEWFSEPKWSSDGKRIAFEKNIRIKRDKYGTIFSIICVVDVKEKKIKEVSQGPDDRYPKWTLDGKVIYLEDAYSEKPRIVCVPMDGKKKEVWLEKEGLQNFYLSPDNKKILLCYGPSKNEDVVILDLLSKKESKITVASGIKPTTAFSCCWSPSSDEIAYFRVYKGGEGAQDSEFPNDPAFFSRLFIFNLKTKQNREIIYSDEVTTMPSWSPNGNWITYYTFYHRDNKIVINELRVVNIVSKYNFYLTCSNDFAAWSPDGKKIAFTRDGSIYISPVIIRNSNFFSFNQR